ncbi:phytanoyl-CoA dioxygenase family protein [[Mycobacterium] vasticus]|uniref:Phytanoyl-CoA dioxygenase family protein n=1 Tax=[Mycobacterium] vasticus TaxID=2875777 RepID=A0ABU5YVS0_9MYCO|nr:phytanoyl-CoA dioxygenase family protein [Mycolicibacter sp. MYC017]MEB3069218.1 phytanoyl-CoA dioxygenase family protein [Mycolicibacter sp. MYC017]
MTDQIVRNTEVGNLEAWRLQRWDFDDFHRSELPRRLRDGVSDQIAWDVAAAPPFTIKLPDGRAYTYICEGGSVRVEPGVSADAVVVLEIQERAWQDYVHEFRNLSSLVLAGSIRFERGGVPEWDAWAPAIRCMYSGKPIYNPSMSFADRAGQPLDLRGSFTLDDDHEELSHFLHTTGYLVVRGAMAHRLTELSDEIDHLLATAKEGNIFSWWVDNEQTGTRFPYRLLYMSEHSTLIRSLMDDDPTVAALVALAKRDLVPLHDRGQGAMTVYKPFGRGAKLGASMAANLGWHRDCDLGGCPVMCPSINIGIHLDPAGPTGSQLWALAGSHDKVTHNPREIRLDDANVIPMDTQPGDVTIHYSCIMHAGPPPVGAGTRRTFYLPFYGPDTLRLLGRFEAFEQVIPGYGTGNLPDFYDEAAKARA